MNLYETLFKKTLLREEGEQISAPSQMQQQYQRSGASISDEDVWKMNNPNIVDNDELSASFDTTGLDKAEIEKYSEVIAKWGEGIQTAIEQLAEIIKFAAGEKLDAAPGSEQFSSLIKDAPRLKKDLSAFKSQVEDLSETVKLAINDETKARKEKINSL